MTKPARDWTAIETNLINFIPLNERHGKVSHQGPFWFLGNFQFFTVSIGFVGPGMGLNWFASCLAGTLGIALGTVFMAFHASQGPEMGLPQMIQSRAQFGYKGVVVPLIAALLTFVAFNVIDTIIVAEGMHTIWGMNAALTTLLLAIVPAALAIWGHDWLHRAFRVLFWCSLPLFAILTIAIVAGGVPLRGQVLSPSAFTWGAFMAQFAAAASYNITYAPYVSDYTRYLPRNVGRGAVIGYVYSGAAVSAIWLIAIGAWLATHMAAHDSMAALLGAGNLAVPGLGYTLVALSAGALIATMGVNAYSAMLTVVTGIDTIRPVRARPALRIAIIALLAIGWLVPALNFTGNAIDGLAAMLVIMLYLLVPWTAINLVDYFYVRKGRYAITAMMDPDGIYGRYNARGLWAYALGLGATLPFFAVPGYWIGPIAARLGGLDVGWLVGLVLTAAIYLGLSRSFDPASEQAAIDRSEQALLTDVP